MTMSQLTTIIFIEIFFFIIFYSFLTHIPDIYELIYSNGDIGLLLTSRSLVGVEVFTDIINNFIKTG